MSAQTLDMAVIGNGRTAALVNTQASIQWWCYPRFDGDPVFCRLVAGKEEKGFTDVLLDGSVNAESQYERNTAIVTTILTSSDGSSIKITDFAPRFRNLGRVTRPPQLIRIIEPLSGLPRVTLRFRPRYHHGRDVPQQILASNHIRYLCGNSVIRLTSDAPLSYIEQEASFVMTRPVHMAFGVDESFIGDLATECRSLYDRTREYWLEWVRRLSIAYDWQDVIIRSAITLKLSNFEETGAIIAAHTTSIPEAAGSGRGWDYRYCWLRDAFFVVKALNRIGATRTMEDYIAYILGLAAEAHTLNPLYGIVPNSPLDEYIAADLEGYNGDGPVRIGNAAWDQMQHDAYGSVILAAMPMFFDRRLPQPAGDSIFAFLEKLGERAAELALKPDAGIWEYRGRQRIHTHSAAMCWAGCSRLGAIATRLGHNERAQYWSKIADEIQAAILQQGWSATQKAFTGAFGSEELDASVLLLPELGLVEHNSPEFVSTVGAIERNLMRGKHVMRYAAEDDFGLPETAFLICRFWLIDALWMIGRHDDARDLFGDVLRYRNSYGLLSEDVHPVTGELWGNFPQTYSMAGLILTGMRLSRSWEDRYWRASS